MRHPLKDKIEMKYALFLSETPIYKTDEYGNVKYDSYTDSEGNVYTYPLEEGETELSYYDAVPLKASFSMSGGEAEAQAYGLSFTDYEAKVLYSRGAYPIKEGTLVWVDSDVEYRYNGEEVEFDVNGEKIKTRVPNPASADYRTVKVVKTKNEIAVLLKAINK